MKQVNEPNKAEQWMIRQQETNAVCTSIDSVAGYNLSNQLPSTAPYTTHPTQGAPVMQPPVTQ